MNPTLGVFLPQSLKTGPEGMSIKFAAMSGGEHDCAATTPEEAQKIANRLKNQSVHKITALEGDVVAFDGTSIVTDPGAGQLEILGADGKAIPASFAANIKGQDVVPGAAKINGFGVMQGDDLVIAAAQMQPLTQAAEPEADTSDFTPG